MDREIPKGNTDLYILSAANKWHPYAAEPLPVTSPLRCVCVCVCAFAHVFNVTVFTCSVGKLLRRHEFVYLLSISARVLNDFAFMYFPLRLLLSICINVCMCSYHICVHVSCVFFCECACVFFSFFNVFVLVIIFLQIIVYTFHKRCAKTLELRDFNKNIVYCLISNIVLFYYRRIVLSIINFQLIMIRKIVSHTFLVYLAFQMEFETWK